MLAREDGLVVAEVEEGENDKEVDYCEGVAFDVEDECLSRYQLLCVHWKVLENIRTHISVAGGDSNNHNQAWYEM